MIIIAPMFFTLAQVINLPGTLSSGSLVLFGLYYGFLTTLPLGTSQLSFIRALLLEGHGKENQISPSLENNNKILSSSVGGLIIGQLIVLLSIYCPPLYSFWFQPYTLSVLILPYLLLWWYRIKRFEPMIGFAQEQKRHISLGRNLFLDSFFFQLLNPVLLPNPVFQRLVNIFLFRYSHIPFFLIGGIVGFLGGHTVFIFLSSLLLLRLERDTPIIYRLLKRMIHQIFPPIVFTLCLTYLGRSPISSFVGKFLTEPQLLYQRPWPDIIFHNDTWNRPLRLINKKRFTQNKGNNKKYFSQFFFHPCVSDGHQRLLHNFPESVSLIHKNLETYLNILPINYATEDNIYKEWLSLKLINREKLNKNVFYKVEALDKGIAIEDVIEKKLSSFNISKQIVRKNNDPRLKQIVFGRKILQSSKEMNNPRQESFHEFKQLTGVKNTAASSINSLKQNSLKTWISQKYETIGGNIIAPWYTLEIDPNENLYKWIEKRSTNTQILTQQKFNWEIFLETCHPLLIQSGGLVKDSVYKWRFSLTNIELPIFDLIKCNGKSIRSFFNLSQYNLKHGRYIDFLDMYKPMPLWKPTSPQDIFKGGSGRSKRANFSRGLSQDVMRAKRRKALLLYALQNKLHAPFFVRIGKEESTNALKSSEFNLQDRSRDLTVDPTQAASSIAKRFDFIFSHLVRGFLLTIQSYFRKYIKLPIFIISKNIARLMLFQTPEWKQDWQEWSQEIYIRCLYDGTDISTNERLSKTRKLWTEGMQIKIIFPFHIRPWHKSSLTEFKMDDSLNKYNINNKNRKVINNDVYLTIWGQETDIPFGKIKRKPSFWKPINKGLQIVLLRQIKNKLSGVLNIYKNISCLFTDKYKLLDKYFKTFTEYFWLFQNKIAVFVNGNTTDSQKFNNSISTNKLISIPESKAYTITTLQKNDNFFRSDILTNKVEDKKQLSQETRSSNPDFNNLKDMLVTEQPFLHMADSNLSKQTVLSISDNKIYLSDLDIKKQLLDSGQKDLTNLIQNDLVNTLTSSIKLKRYALVRSTNIINKKLKVSRFKIHLISLESRKAFHYNIIEMKSIYIQTQKLWINLIRKLKRFSKNIHIDLYKNISRLNKAAFYSISKISNLLIEQVILIDRFLEQTLQKITRIFFSWFLNPNKDNLNSHNIILTANNKLDTDFSKDKIKLSQAYLLHKIWQSRIFSRPDLSSLMRTWQPDTPLSRDLQDYLIKQDIFRAIEPEDMNAVAWSEWLRVFRRYTPSYQLWSKIIPYNWKNEVTQYWKKDKDVFNYSHNDFNNIIDKHKYRYDLPYYKTIIQKGKKLSKRWGFQILFHRYINCFNTEDFYELPMWQSSEYDQILSNRFNIIKRFQKDFIEDIDKINSFNDNIRWGRARPFKPFLLPWELSKIDDVGGMKTSTPYQIKNFLSFATPKQRVCYTTQSGTLKKDIYFVPASEYRWKSRELRARFYNLMKTARLNLIMRRNLNKNKLSFISDNIQKDLKLLTRLQTTKLFFTRSLQAWRCKTLDDQVLIHNMAGSLLRFNNRYYKYFNFSSPILKDFVNMNIIFPEEVLVPNSCRKLRLFNHLNFQQSFEKLDRTLKHIVTPVEPNIYSTDKQVITRFLWPTYRLEDLACLNRFSIGSANHSRFSIFRISMYPINY
uniref:Protein TIC 214 n=1 Tax=Netrium digitus TaxID=43946 RepID=A0A191T583_9VIRI|nr:hypothetical chloroplast RF1 [Netrium digitus]ANI25542.1 hypothetical chloroplast RF1 [Netrium digitus]